LTHDPQPAILLFNDECSVCGKIASWVAASTHGTQDLVVRPIGDDPRALERLRPGLDIWDAYATVHLLMPDGSTKTGGAAVAEVLRRLPNTARFAELFAMEMFGVHPFARALDAGYAILAEIRPLMGCESCGSTNALTRSVLRAVQALQARMNPNGNHPAPLHAAATHRVRATGARR
jgi:predicted DCC family thiol-disulfide oxidoreductase YuxK